MGNRCSFVMKLPSGHSFSPKNRSRLMASIRSRGNKTTEQRLASGLRAAGIIGWRRHAPLPGTPDFVFRKERLCVFVHGCFWHGCRKCYRAPRTRAVFWQTKVKSNHRRDAARVLELRQRGYRVLVLWECELKGDRLPHACERIARTLRTPSGHRTLARGRFLD